MYKIRWCLLLGLMWLSARQARGQELLQEMAQPDIIQISGVTMTADSLRAVPNVTVTVKSENRGVISNDYGIFALVCEKGDTLVFSSIGYRTTQFVVDRRLTGKYYNLVQLMVQDTFYLPETIITSLPRGAAFDYAFKNWEIPADGDALIYRNMNPAVIASLQGSLPRNGRESQSAYQRGVADRAYYSGQIAPMNIMNPLKWAEFFAAWKRGDFRKKY